MNDSTKTTNIRPIRLSDEIVDAAMQKGKTYDLVDLSAVVRLALNKLKPARN